MKSLPLLSQFFCLTLILLGSLAHGQDRSLELREQKELLRKADYRMHVAFSKLDDATKAPAEEIEKANAERFMKYNQLRKSHPELKEIATKADEASARLTKAMTAGDKAAAEAAKKDYAEQRIALEKKSGEIPEIVALQKQMNETQAQHREKMFEILSKTPEGKAIVDEVKLIETKISGLTK